MKNKDTDDTLWNDRHPETKDVVVQEPNAVLLMAMQKDYSLEQIEKMMDLQDRKEKNDARKAYVVAMAKFKANPPEILKTVQVCYTNSKNQEVKWDHAALGEVCEAIVAGMAPHGLYHRWDMTQKDSQTVKTTCIVTHDLGHSEETAMSGPPDTSGGKDALKAMSSTNTFLQRLTLLSITGLAAKGIDREQPNPEPVQKFINKEQAKDLNALIESCGDKAIWAVDKILKLNQIDSLDDLPAKEVKKVVKWINDTVKKAKP